MLAVCSNVVVNLRFCTAEARRLGVDGHVCELQLNLASFVACMVWIWMKGGGAGEAGQLCNGAITALWAQHLELV